jgi:predicted  nucleic acid-binding Zn-ribbon protein
VRSGSFHAKEVEEDLRQLLIYQQYDRRLLELEKSSALRVRDGQTLGRRRLDGEGRLADALAKRAANGNDLRAAEVELAETHAKLKALELRSGRVKNSLQGESVGEEERILRAKKARCEEKCLTLMEVCENGDREVDDLRAELKVLFLSIDDKLGEFKGAASDSAKVKTELENMLSHLRGSIGKNWMGAYDRLRSSKLPPPYVCPVEGNRCNGCRMHMAANGAGCGNSPARHCEFCNRIIYEEDTEIENEEPAI